MDDKPSREPFEALREVRKWRERLSNSFDKVVSAEVRVQILNCIEPIVAQALAASAEPSQGALEANRRWYERMRPEGIYARPDSIPVGSSRELYSTLNRATLMEIVLLRDAKLCAETASTPVGRRQVVVYGMWQVRIYSSTEGHDSSSMG